ncbi:GTPase Era [Pendulispora albinea]|uniref:GTPase Era n=1 Tax=Pendulispora albinea TaxID=2741071 RepID=A0ABZ2LJ49_9BACT
MPHLRVGTVALVGRPNVGKSTLLNAMLGERIAIVSHHPQTTRDRILGVLTQPDAQFVFLDTPGLHAAKSKLGARMNHEAREAARDADVVVFVTSVGVEPAPGVGRFDAALLGQIRDASPKTPVVLVINKVDRVADKSALIAVLQAYAEAFPFAALVPISAKKHDGLERVLSEVKKLLPEDQPLYEADTLTDRPLRFLVAEFVREQILRATREEVPHGVAVVVDRFDESGKVPKIELSVHVDREGHKKILVGKQGAVLKEVGSRARARVEALMGRQVHLAIWVRVTPGWYESDRGLREMGYIGGADTTAPERGRDSEDPR